MGIITVQEAAPNLQKNARDSRESRAFNNNQQQS